MNSLPSFKVTVGATELSARFSGAIALGLALDQSGRILWHPGAARVAATILCRWMIEG
ncbi:hypothetical protein [Cupriavidus sp. 8B]